MPPLPAFLERRLNAAGARAPYRVSEDALELHERLTVIDLHADPLMWSRDLLARNAHGHVDVPRLIEGGVSLQVFSTVTHAPLGINIDRNWGGMPDMMTALCAAQGWPSETWGSFFERAKHQAKALERACAESKGRMSRILTKEDLADHVGMRREGQTAALLSVEGGQCFEGDPRKIDALFNAGVRMAGLAHFVDNELGGSASGWRKGGLTDFGREALRRMEDLGIAVDLAHASPKLFDDVIREGRAAPLVSHAGACSACPNARNLTDAQMRAVAEKGGVVGMGFWRTATGGEDAEAIARGVLAVIKAAGVRCAALGSDFDGAVAVPFDAAGMPLVTQALLEKGLPEDEIAAVMGGNALRFLTQSLPEY